MSFKRKPVSSNSIEEEDGFPAVKKQKHSHDICTKFKSSILKHLGMSKTQATATKTSATCSESADTNCKSSANAEKISQKNLPRELEARSEASNENNKKKKDSKQSGFKRMVQQATSFLKKSEMSKAEDAVSEQADDTDSPSVSKGADNEQADTNITKSQSKGRVNFSMKRKHKVFKANTLSQKDDMSRLTARVSEQAKSISTNDYSACDKKTLIEEEDIDVKPGRRHINFGIINAELARKEKTVNELKASRSQDVVASDEMLGKFKNIKEREDTECREMSTGVRSTVQTLRNNIAQKQRNLRKPNLLQKSISVCPENKNEMTEDSETKQNLTGMVRKNTWPLLSRGSTAHHIATRLEGHDKQPENRGRRRLHRTRHASQSKHYFKTSWGTHRDYSSSHQYEYMPESKEEEEEEKYTFFWRKYSPFSQHHACKFVIDGVTYNCAEQYMMYRKAALFNDEEMIEKIMETSDPVLQKKCGRMVKNFDIDVWKPQARDIVKKANLAKFSQNEDLKKALMDTEGTVLVEASPVDRLWGIGLAADDERAKRKSTWRGENWLGYVLTDVRDCIKFLEED